MYKRLLSVSFITLTSLLLVVVTTAALGLQAKNASEQIIEATIPIQTYTQPITIHVPADYLTIQAAINAAQYGDTVLVAAGIYTELIAMKSGVSVQGTGGSLLTPNDPFDDSVIDGAQSGRTVYFGNASNAAIIGFTVKNGRGGTSGGNIHVHGEANIIQENLIIDGATVGGGGYGGGIYLSYSAHYAQVINNVIRDNWAWASGGGIMSRAQDVVIEGNVIVNNQSDWAGGIYVSGSTIIRKNLFDSNFADFRDGGGIYLNAAQAIMIENNTIVNNRAHNWGVGGAIYVNQADELTIQNNIIADNLNADTGGIYFVTCPVTLTLMYNDAFNNQGNDYTGCTPGTGSIAMDPLFVDPANQDYHLQPGSPAIDAGNPDPGYNDPEDPANPGYALYPAMGTIRNDMGAYGGKAGTEPFVPLNSVAILGPTQGIVSNTSQFTATISPVYASQPITYTWQPTPTSGQGTAMVTYQWTSSGEQHLLVTATNSQSSATSTHTIVVEFSNIPPTAHDDQATTDEDMAVAIPALANDTDPENGPLTLLNVTNPLSGTASIVGSQIVYTPMLNFNGLDLFTYTISDGEYTSQANVTVLVNPVNDPPVAASDWYTTRTNVHLTIPAPGVLSNDGDIEGDTITAVLDTAPAHGSILLNPDGSFTYTPQADFSGQDNFTYQVLDGQAVSNLATVFVTVSQFTFFLPIVILQVN